MSPIFKYNAYTLALHEHGIAVWKATTSNTSERDTSLFKEPTMERWKAVMCLRACVGLLAGFLLLVRLHLLLTQGVVLDDSAVLSWLMPATQVMHLSPAWESSWDAWPAGCNFSEWQPFFFLATCLEPEALYLGECPLHTLSCDAVGRKANPEHSLMCFFICWPEEVTALRQVPHAKFAL